MDATFCGAEANVAVSLSVFGVDPVFVTKLPDSDVGLAAAHSLDYFKVDTSKIVYGDGRVELYYLEKDALQRPSKVIYDRTYSAIATAKRNEFDWDSIFDGADWFHWTGINPALSEKLALICEDACEAAKAQKIMKSLMKYVDVCICNEEDAEKALGIKHIGTDVKAGELNDAGYVHTAEMIYSYYGCKYVATTLRRSYSVGKNGWRTMLYNAEALDSYFSREYDIRLVDRVGGGDSFGAGLIYSLGTRMGCQESIEFATAASSLKQIIEGDFNRSTVQDVRALLKSGGNGCVQR